jgi:hypothetical protein
MENTASQRNRQTAMGGLLGEFTLETFNEFFNAYKATNVMAPEALMVLEHFFPALNEFFDLCDNLTEDMIMDHVKVYWYSYTNMVASSDYIRAKSKHYYEPEFSNVSINMSEEDTQNYNTDDGACFGKV